jgi:hypothetical protein
MAQETDTQKLKRKAVYEAMSPGEKIFYHGFQAINIAKDLKHKLGERFGKEMPTTVEEIEMLKQKKKELEEQEALESERNKLLEYIEQKARQRGVLAVQEHEKG